MMLETAAPGLTVAPIGAGPAPGAPKVGTSRNATTPTKNPAAARARP